MGFNLLHLHLLGILLCTTIVHGDQNENGLKGYAFLEGIRHIIGADPHISPQEIERKPFGGSFSNLHPSDDLSEVSYCLTDNACDHFEAYSEEDVPLSLLSCNHFCYIDPDSYLYRISEMYSTDYPPRFYLNCGWETCG